MFALLPAQCAVCVSPVLCLLNVLPAQFTMWGYDKSSYYYFILLFLLFLPIPTSWEWMSMGFSIITAS